MKFSDTNDHFRHVAKISEFRSNRDRFSRKTRNLSDYHKNHLWKMKKNDAIPINDLTEIMEITENRSRRWSKTMILTVTVGQNLDFG